MGVSPTFPFVDLSVQPSYGKHRVVLTWRVNPGYEAGNFYIYRSIDGAPPWTLLNPDTPVTDRLFFEDDTFIVENILQMSNYRILLEKDGKQYKSPIVGFYSSSIDRAEFGAVRQAMRAEYVRMRAKRGLRVLLYTPLLTGTPAPGFMEDSGQVINSTNIDPDKDSYGQRFIGGYNPPTETWLSISSVAPTSFSERPDGMSNEDTSISTARMLVFPLPKAGDLIIHPPTDNRYGIGDQLKVFRFKGIIPVACEAQLQLISRNDPRYRVPVPVLPPPEPFSII